MKRILLGIFAWSVWPNAFGQPTAVEARDIAELNLSIAIFNPGVPEDPLRQQRAGVLPDVRKIEAILLPFMLRQVLVETGSWGAVRVVPEPDPAAELLLSGEIVRSDGNALELRMRAIDASGRSWLDNVYVSAAETAVDQGDTRVDLYGYQVLFESIAGDLLTARDNFDEAALAGIRDISFLRYASQLAPDIFSGYLGNEPDGTFSIQRLPAENDPMAERIERVRGVEYQLIDTVDERFQELHAEIESIYDLWLDYRRQVALYENRQIARVQNPVSTAPRGSYESVRSLYDNYRQARMQEQLSAGRAQAFSNEVGPTMERMQSRVAELEYWLEQQYMEWRDILSEIFALETGF